MKITVNFLWWGKKEARLVPCDARLRPTLEVVQVEVPVQVPMLLPFPAKRWNRPTVALASFRLREYRRERESFFVYVQESGPVKDMEPR